MTNTSPTLWKLDHGLAPLFVFAFAVILFAINLDRPPDPDELHHVLAAQHLLETGRPILADGEYHRGILHTWMVAISYKLFGEGLVSARIPPVLLVALTALVLFVWIRREAGALAAWLTAGLFISSPFTVEIAQFSRFYGLQMVSFVLGSICAYYMCAVDAPILRRVALAAAAIALLLLAMSAQVTTFVGLGGIAAWVFCVIIGRAFVGRSWSTAAKIAMSGALIASALLIAFIALKTNWLEQAWWYYRYVPLFNESVQDEFWFYYLRFLLFYPTLWTLVGVAALLAVVYSPRLAWYSISIFAISFLLMSFAGTKATRYVSFAPPYLAIIWGLALGNVLPSLWRYTATTRIRLMETLALPDRLKPVLATAALVTVLVTTTVTNPFWLRTATVIANVTIPGDKPNTDWRVAREALADWTTNADVVIASEELGALYFLGRADFTFNPSKIDEIENQVEFGIDQRTGRPIITEPESLQQLIQCFQRGLFVGPIEHWGDPTFVSQEVGDVLAQYATPVEVPEASHLYAWGWNRQPPMPRPGFCSDLDRFSGLRRMAHSHSDASVGN